MIEEVCNHCTGTHHKKENTDVCDFPAIQNVATARLDPSSFSIRKNKPTKRNRKKLLLNRDVTMDNNNIQTSCLLSSSLSSPPPSSSSSSSSSCELSPSQLPSLSLKLLSSVSMNHKTMIEKENLVNNSITNTTTTTTINSNESQILDDCDKEESSDSINCLLCRQKNCDCDRCHHHHHNQNLIINSNRFLKLRCKRKNPQQQQQPQQNQHKEFQSTPIPTPTTTTTTAIKRTTTTTAVILESSSHQKECSPNTRVIDSSTDQLSKRLSTRSQNEFLSKNTSSNIVSKSIEKTVKIAYSLVKFYSRSNKCKNDRTFNSSIFCSVSFLGIIVLFSFMFSLLQTSAKANETSPLIHDIALRNQESEEICRSMDIRNRPHEFYRLTKCRIVEGFLMITLMDKYTSADYDNLTFPLLTEITDYLLVYRINGLTSIGRLFPNLSVIRGNVLFEGYALVIYENMQLDEIGLTSLTHIKRGGVRIERNPKLCFVSSIDWFRIAVNSTPESHFMKENRLTNECPLCPGGGTTSLATEPLFAPRPLPICNATKGDNRLCWNQQNCQKICPDHCGARSCNTNHECCDDTCLGGCSDDNPSLCTVCKHFTIGTFSDRRCASKCPANLFRYMDRRCITAYECRNIPRPINMDPSYPDYPFIPFKEECSVSCPTGYEKVLNGTCQPCKDKCIKKCAGGSIDNISGARKLRGCTSIMGSLIINIRQGAHVVEELEASLSAIEEIEGFLKVTRTYSIVSFSFLRNLKHIHGDTLDANKYALYVLDNQNLQNLWGENQTVAIERGKIFFHFNPKLCYYKIEALKPMIHDNDTFEKSDVALDSNGDRIACKITVLNATVIKVHSRAAVAEVGPMEFEDERVFLGYQYYIMEAPYTNVSMYQSRHGCGNDAWNVDDDTSKDIFHLFSHLKPYTQYAFYVKTYTIASEQHGGQSEIKYFRTLPDKPEPVRNLQYIANGSSEIVISWEQPKVANGLLKEYKIRAVVTYDDAKLLEQRNYCNEPIKEIQEIQQPTIKKDPDSIKDGEHCPCAHATETTDGSHRTHIEESEVENVIEFEDAIQNFVYIKRKDDDGQDIGTAVSTDTKIDATERLRKKRIKRYLEMSDSYTEPPARNPVDVFPVKDQSTIKLDDVEDEEPQRDEHGNYKTFSIKVNTSVTSFVLNELKHYSTYTIGVRACRDGTGLNCSNEIIINSRTLKINDADNIDGLTAKVQQINNTLSTVKLVWRPPSNPNSLIVSYSIKYVRVDVEHAKRADKCITQREFQNLSRTYILRDLDSGNYSVQVMATSLAGDGNFTAPVYFYIPKPGLGWQTITAIVSSIVILLVLIGVLIYYIRRKFRHPPADLKLFTSVNPEYISMQYTPDEWEIPRDKIIQLSELGQGSFGMVYEGIVKSLSKELPGDTRCAIKTVNESATDRERINFLNEASVMKAFDTFHVVRLLGVVSRGQPTLVVMELMTNGDLKGYLRLHRPDTESLKTGEPPSQPPTLKRILQMAIEIADGMAYLSAKKFVHRDLAARNCMVSDDLTVKIGDFGMTRDIYETDYYRKGTKGLLPVRWMAPESLKDGVFTSSSDVFSYGVVLWEMATLASQPYQGLSNDQVLRYVIDGGVMERPENCPDKLYNLMRRCWQHRPSSRPSFINIIQNLLDDADTKFGQVSFYHSQEGQEIREQMVPIPDPDDVTTPLRMDDDEFKIDVDDNFLMDRTNSHLVQEEQPHSPYSLGSAVILSSSSTTPGGASKLPNYNEKNNSPLSSLKINNSSATGTVQTPRSSSNLLAPKFFRMDFLRNAFLKNGNTNNNINSSSGNNGNSSGIDLQYPYQQQEQQQQTNDINSIEDGGDKNAGLKDSGRGSSSGKSNTRNFLFGGGFNNGNKTKSDNINDLDYEERKDTSKRGDRRYNKDPSINYKKLNLSMTTKNPLFDNQLEPLSMPSLPLIKPTKQQQPQIQQQQQPQQQQKQQQQQNQCNDYKNKVNNSNVSSNSLYQTTASPPYQQQTHSHKNGYIISGNKK